MKAMAFGIAAMMLIGGGLHAESRTQALPIEALTDLTAPISVAISPDGRRVAAVIQSPIEQATYDGSGGIRNTYRTILQVIDIQTGAAASIGPAGHEAENPVWSPDGSKLVFQVDTDDRARLWVWSAQTGKSRQIADVVPRNTPARWTPNGANVVAAVLPEGATYSTLKQRWGSAKSDSAYPLDDRAPGTRVAVYQANNLSAGGRGQKGEAQIGKDRSEDYARNNLNHSSDVALIDIASGRVSRLVRGFRPVDYRVSPDGRHVSFTHIAGQQAGSGYRNLYDLNIVSVEGGTPKTLVKSVLQIGNYMEAVWSPDGHSLAFCDSGPGTNNDCYIAGVDGAKVQKVSRPPSAAKENWRTPFWDSDGRLFYLRGATALWQVRVSDAVAEPIPALQGKQVIEIIARGDSRTVIAPGKNQLIARTRDLVTKAEGLYVVDTATHRTTKLWEEAQQLGHIDISADATRVVYTTQKANAPEQIWENDLAFRHPRQLTQLNQQLNGYRFGNSRLVRWRGPQGGEMQGALLLPSDYVSGKQYPLIVYLYPDRKQSNDLNIFGFNNKAGMPYENMQLLATRGYAVLLPDTETRVGTLMRDLVDGLMPAVDKLVEEGVADPDRLGIMGRSYGGYGVLSILVQTKRFKAAIEVCGFANLTGAFTEMTPAGTHWKSSFLEDYPGRMGGTLWEYRDRYIENSPLFYFDRIATPLLVVHGTEDTAVFVHNGDEIFQALRRLGKEVEYAKYIGEPHVIVSQQQAIDYANRMIGWFDRYLQPATARRH